MAERRPINRYYPRNFDPSKIPFKKHKNTTKNPWIKVRTMLPLSVCCDNCRNYIYTGKKTNATRQDSKREKYLGIPIIRFVFNCYHCGNKICYKTDPKQGDYKVESGGKRIGYRKLELDNMDDEEQEGLLEKELGTLEEQIFGKNTDQVAELETAALKRQKELEEIRELVVQKRFYDELEKAKKKLFEETQIF